ncbi:MAG: hypothetical protein COB14_01600 [Alphaproteobacteria bacterium]|nr:MAG: hypothetical protein COB14_01600 [Alphaproteobacteria bacterium]
MLQLLCAVVLFAVTSLSSIADEGELNVIRFPIHMWDKALLDIIDIGPLILSRDEEIVMQPHPENDSDITKKELEYLLHIAQTERSEDNIRRINYENGDVRVFDIFKREGLIPDNNYKVLNLLEMVDNDYLYFTLFFKKHFSRPRPSQLSEIVTGTLLDLVIENPHHAAYPSGHSGQTYIVALVLADLDPKNADVYKQFSIDVAHRREISGVHYPSDSEAGRQLARDVYATLKKIPAFNKKLDDVKEAFIKPSKDVITAVNEFKRYYE